MKPTQGYFEKPPITNIVELTRFTYATMARQYAETWFNDPAVESILERFLRKIDRNGAVLDVGCGPGRDVHAISKMGVIAVGIDNCEEMLSEARKRVPNGSFRRMDMRFTVYPQNAFAGLWVCASFHHLPTSESLPTLREFRRILQPGGVLCISVKLADASTPQQSQSEHNGIYTKHFRRDEFTCMLDEADFEILESETSTSSKNTFGARRINTWLTVFATKKHSSQLDRKSLPDDSCDLCLDGRQDIYRKHGIHRSTSILWGNDEVYVIPDISPLTEGHLLIVSVKHFCSFGSKPGAAMLAIEAAKQTVHKLYRQVYKKPALFFEHGAALPGKAGACIDHAHLHCLPAILSLKSALDQKLGPGTKVTMKQLQEMHEAARSYLFLEEEPHGSLAYPVDVLPCQFHRRIVAELMGGKEWDWHLTRFESEERGAYARTLAQMLPLVDGSLQEEILSYRRHL